MTVRIVGPGMTSRMVDAATKASQCSIDTVGSLYVVCKPSTRAVSTKRSGRVNVHQRRIRSATRPHESDVCSSYERQVTGRRVPESRRDVVEDPLSRDDGAVLAVQVRERHGMYLLGRAVRAA